MQARNQRSKKVPAEVKSFVKAQLVQNIELRKADFFGTFPVAPTSGPLAMNNIAVANRVGEVVHFDKVRLSFGLAVGAGVSVTQYVRCLIFEWRPLSIPTQTDILETLTSNTIINSPHKFTTREFYRVVYDKVFPLTPNATLAVQHTVKETKVNSRRRFDDSIVPARTVGLLYVMWVSDEGTPSQPTLDYNIRTTYSDA